MTMAANNEQAASLAYQQIVLSWGAGTLLTTLQQFNAAAGAIFEDAIPNDRPVGSWLVLLTALAAQVAADGSGSTTSQEFLNSCVEYVFGMCQCAQASVSFGLISSTKATALVAAWNAAWGT